MNIIEQLKPFLRDDANITELETKLTELTTISADKLKELMGKPENKPVFDSIVGKSITTHIEKEKLARSTWEETRSAELLEEAKSKIAKESQKSDLEIKFEAMEKTLSDKNISEARATLKSTLLDIIKSDSLPIDNADPFLSYGESAESELRKFAEHNTSLINDLVKKQLADKFGGGGMPGGKPPIDDKEISTEDHINNIFNKNSA